MSKTSAAVFGLCLFAFGVACGYALNESLRFRVAVAGAKAAGGVVKNYVQNTCDENPNLHRCKFLKKPSSGQD